MLNDHGTKELKENQMGFMILMRSVSIFLQRRSFTVHMYYAAWQFLLDANPFSFKHSV